MTELVGELGGWGGLGSTGILAIVVMMILAGRLVTRQQLLDLMKERDDWKTAYLAEAEGRRMASEQVNDLLEVNRTITAVVHALPLPQNPVPPSDHRATS